MGPAPAVAAVRLAVRTALTGLTGLTGSSPVLVACSGGPDSLALAAATAFEALRAGRPAGLVTVDHGLSPGSHAQAERIAAVGYELGLDPVLLLPVEVGVVGGPEAAARTARYGALDAVAASLSATVFLGHTLDDQAETVLLGLGRGSGPRSLAGMAPGRGPYRRPLLGIRRTTTVAACRALGLDAWDDPHNSDPAYQRVRVRTEVLPLLEQVLKGGVAEALARTAELAADDLDALDGWAAQMTPSAVVDGELDVNPVAGLPRAVRTRVIRAWLADHGVTGLSAERTAAVDTLVADWRGQSAVDVPGGATVRRTAGRLVLARPPAR